MNERFCPSLFPLIALLAFAAAKPAAQQETQQETQQAAPADHTPRSSHMAARMESPAASVEQAGARFSTVRLYLTGNRIGNLLPCHCKENSGGGYDRELAYYRSRPNDGILTIKIDGGYQIDPSINDGVRLQALHSFMGFEMLGFDASAASSLDLDVGLDALKEAARRYSLPFISANARRADTGELIFPPSRIIEAPAAKSTPPLRIGVIGLTNPVPPEYPAGTIVRYSFPGFSYPVRPAGWPDPLPREFAARREYRTDPLQESIQAEWVKLRLQCNAVGVAGFISRPVAHDLARQFPELAFILAGDDTEPAPIIEQEGSTRIVTPGREAVYIVEVMLRFDSGKTAGEAAARAIKLDRSMKQDAAIASLWEATYMMKKEADTNIKFTPNPNKYAGAWACRACHEPQFKRWAKTRHMGAHQALINNNQQYNALCISCHTMGVGPEGRYESPEAAARLGGVQCESCHGPSYDHATETSRRWRKDFRGIRPAAGEPAEPAPPKPGRVVQPQSCLLCHNSSNSPGFNPMSSYSTICVPREENTP